MGKGYSWKDHNNVVNRKEAAYIGISMFKLQQDLRKEGYNLTDIQITMILSIYLMRLGGDEKYTVRKLFNFMYYEEGLDIDLNYGTFKNLHTRLSKLGFVKKGKASIRFELSLLSINKVISKVSYIRNYVSTRAYNYSTDYYKY